EVGRKWRLADPAGHVDRARALSGDRARVAGRPLPGRGRRGALERGPARVPARQVRSGVPRMRPLRLRTLNRYIAIAIGQSFLLSLGTLVAVFSVINATEELQQVGIGHYGVRQALWFVALTTPNQAYALFPAAALLGSVIALGGLAQRNELVAIGA